jgi:hypothetical protein
LDEWVVIVGTSTSTVEKGAVVAVTVEIIGWEKRVSDMGIVI